MRIGMMVDTYKPYLSGVANFYVSLRHMTHHKKLLQTMDVVHVHQPFLSGRLALNYRRSDRIPIVFTNHARYDLLAQAYITIRYGAHDKYPAQAL